MGMGFEHTHHTCLLSGKGPWDGIGGCIKNYVRLIIRFGRWLKNPSSKDIYEFLVSLMSKFTRPGWASSVNNILDEIKIHWVSVSDVRRPVNFQCTPVDGVRSNFCFAVTTSGKLAKRWLSCYCSFYMVNLNCDHIHVTTDHTLTP